MASERPVGIATKENAIAILRGAVTRLKIGWCTFYDHIDTQWSCVGALGESGRELKLYYQQGCYALMDLIDQELFMTKMRLRLEVRNNAEPKDQEEALLIFTTTLDRLCAESHSQSAETPNESEKADERHQDSKEASGHVTEGLSQQG